MLSFLSEQMASGLRRKPALVEGREVCRRTELHELCQGRGRRCFCMGEHLPRLPWEDSFPTTESILKAVKARGREGRSKSHTGEARSSRTGK